MQRDKIAKLHSLKEEDAVARNRHGEAANLTKEKPMLFHLFQRQVRRKVRPITRMVRLVIYLKASGDCAYHDSASVKATCIDDGG
jgi:hypothetical protein